MIDISILRPGMKLKVVDSWNPDCDENPNGRMDKYRGQIVTFLALNGDTILIEEDEGDNTFQTGGHWYWNKFCFDYIVDCDETDFKPSSESEILSFLFDK